MVDGYLVCIMTLARNNPTPPILEIIGINITFSKGTFIGRTHNSRYGRGLWREILDQSLLNA